MKKLPMIRPGLERIVRDMRGAAPFKTVEEHVWDWDDIESMASTAVERYDNHQLRKCIEVGEHQEQHGMYGNVCWPKVVLGREARRELMNRGASMDSDVRRAMEHDLDNH